MKRLAFAALFAAFASSLVTAPALAADLRGQFQPTGPCCIGGKWSGKITQTLSPTCPEPSVGEVFTFVITQDKSCSPTVTGKVTTADGGIKNFTGTVKPLLNRCCQLEGSFTTPGDPTEKDAATIDFCTVNGVLSAKGKATSTSGTPPKQRVCQGSVTMSRLP